MILDVQTNIIGIWTLLTLLSDDSEGLPHKEEYNSSITVNVKCPSGKIIPCSFINTMARSQVLFEEISKQTGVPVKLQMLSYKMNLIQPDIPLQRYRMEDGCCIDLVIKGVGGGNGSDAGIMVLSADCMCVKIKFYFIDSDDEVLDECVSCGEHAHIYCSDCKCSRCKVCDEQWHKHPKRRLHQTKVLLII